MKDLMFDFKKNDIAVMGGDFALSDDPSLQNATLILLKNPVNLMAAQWGVGFETFAINGSPSYVGGLAAEAKRQVIKDGATSCNITVSQGEKYGEYDVNVDAQYPAEPNA